MINLLQLTGFSGFSQADKALSNPAGRLASIISGIISVITIYGGFAFLFYFLISAFTWITGGEAQQLEKAKRQMTHALIGLFFIIITVPLAFLLGKILGIEILNFEAVIPNLTPK
jgi:hypothetical protein